jgi:hypothetical protein
MTQQSSMPEWAHLHREAARWYSEKADAYGRWEARYRASLTAPHRTDSDGDSVEQRPGETPAVRPGRG